MKDRSPFIKKFKTEDNYYIYDVNTSRILLVSAAMYDIVDLYWRKSKHEIIRTLSHLHPLVELERGYAHINELAVEYKLFSPNRLESRVGFLTEREVEERLNRGIQQISLEVTESCNMRCKYCAFSGGYLYNRQHGLRQMSFTTTRAAIDFYLAKNELSTDDLAIGFYGGEPLLRFDLIREVIEYTRFSPYAQNKRVRFSLTTNGTLLTDEMINFFSGNDVAIAISIDGPRQDHDRYRVLKNGRGSFNKVMENVRKIHRMAPEYYETHVLFNCVLTPASDLLKLNKFFTSCPYLFRPGSLMVAGVNPGNPTFLENCERSETRAEDYVTLCRMFLDTHSGMADYNLTFVSALFERDLVRIHKRFIRSEPYEHETISPACFPGMRKLFVSVDGTLHICERINNRFPIGDVFSGFDISRVSEVLNEFCTLMNAEDCKNCWAVRFCTHCFASLAGDGMFCQSLKAESCTGIRDRTKEALITYCSVLERNPNAWKYMDDIIVK